MEQCHCIRETRNAREDAENDQKNCVHVVGDLLESYSGQAKHERYHVSYY
jgi:hypothetical protein